MSKMDVTRGEAFPFATFEGLMNKLDSPELLQFAKEAEIHTSLKNWLKMLQFISDFLEDAEGRQLTERAVKSWLSDLRDLVYDAEDIVDVLYTEMLRTSVSDSDAVAGMSSEMKNIAKGLEDLEEGVEKLDLKRLREIKSNESIKEERITTSLLDHCIVGRKEEKEEILNLLPLSPETTFHKPPSSGAGITDYKYGREHVKARILSTVPQCVRATSQPQFKREAGLDIFIPAVIFIDGIVQDHLLTKIFSVFFLDLTMDSAIQPLFSKAKLSLKTSDRGRLIT
ncbi:Rx, N-terminal [Dillenia turbinata]|uniref:Rx, N-terminal n=1 Tax=Dillenia turbinata TaxID=194707 RepID=A0AAN8VDQ6_9MAGN